MQQNNYFYKILTICFLIFSISANIYANLYFSKKPKEDIPLLHSIDKRHWRPLETVYRIYRGQKRKHCKEIDKKDYYSLKSTESMLFQISSLSLVRIDISKTFEQLDSSVLENIQVYQISELTEPISADTEISNLTKVRVIPIVDESGQIYIRAPVGDTISYEIKHQLERPLKLGFFKMEYLLVDFFWEELERRIIRELNSDKAKEFIEYLTSLSKNNIERTFIEKQLVVLPWFSEEKMTLAERQYRLAKFFCDILYARREDNSVFKERKLKLSKSEKAFQVKKELFYEITSANAIHFQLTGPRLIKITTRFVYPKHITDEVQSYKLFCYQDSLLRKIFYENTVLDDLEGITLDKKGRPQGRKRVEYLLVPPGKHEYRLVSEHNLLVNIYELEKRLHFTDSLTGSEDSERWIEKALENVEAELKAEPDNLRMLYLKGCCLHLMNLHQDAFVVYKELSAREEELKSQDEFLLLAGIYLHLAQLYAEEEKYPDAFNSLSFALRYCESANTESDFVNLTELMIKTIGYEKAKLFRRTGKHLEAVQEYKLILQNSPMDSDTRFLRAETLAWGHNLTALEEYDKTLKLNPRNIPAAYVRQRFWWDYTYWKTVHPSRKPQSRGQRVIDSSETECDNKWTEAGITIERKSSAFSKVKPNIPLEIKLTSLEKENSNLKILCYSNTDMPWQLEVDIDGISKINLPVVWKRNEFELPISSGVHNIIFHSPDSSKVNDIFINASYCSNKDKIPKRWYERLFFPVPVRDEKVEDIQSALEYHINSSAKTYVRGLVHINSSSERIFAEKISLVVCIDDKISAEVVLEKFDYDISNSHLHEFVLPIPEGYHKISVWQKEGFAETILNFSYRTIREEEVRKAGNPENQKARKPGALPPGSQKIRKSTFSNSKYEILDAIKLFTKSVYLAEESDSAKYQAYIERAKALRQLEEYELALYDCLRIIDSSYAEEAQKNQARIQLADIYLDMGGKQDLLKALKEYTSLLEDGIDNIHIRLKLGQIYQMEDELQAATAQYDSILEFYPYQPEVLFNQAVIEIRKGSLSSAASNLDKLLYNCKNISEEFLWKYKAKYLRGKVAILMNDFETARRCFISVIDDAKSDIIQEGNQKVRNSHSQRKIIIPALSSQAKWELNRIDEAKPLFELFQNADSPTKLAELYYEIGEFNAEWIESPRFYFTDEFSEVFKENWKYLGDENIIDYTSKTATSLKESEVDIGDYFLISDESCVVLQTKGPTLLRLDVRPVHLITEVECETKKRIDIKVFIEEEGVVRKTESIEDNKYSEEVIYPELMNVVPGRREQILYRIESGIHKFKVRTSSGIAHLRPYVLHPSPEDYFITEKDNVLHIEQAKRKSFFFSSFWYTKALLQSLELLDSTDNLYRRAKSLIALNLDKKSSLEVLHRVLKDKEMDKAEYKLGKLYLSTGEYKQALLHFDKASKTDIESLQKNAWHHKIRTMIKLSHRIKEFETIARKYDEYCINYSDDIKAKLELASLCLLLGKKSSEITEKTYWYNRALNLYTLITQIHPELKEAKEGLSLAKSKTQWERIRTVQNSAGHQDIVESEASDFSLKEALLPPLWDRGSYVFLSADSYSGFSLAILHPARIAVQLFGQMFNPTKEESEYRVICIKDGEYHRTLEGKLNEIMSYEIGNLSPGKHILQFVLEKSNDEPNIMMRFLSERNLQLEDETISNLSDKVYIRKSQQLSQEWYIIRPNRQRKYFIASYKTPVQTSIQGPTQLRIITRRIFDQKRINPDEEYSLKVRLIRRTDSECMEYSYKFTSGISEFAWLREESKSVNNKRTIGDINEVVIPILESSLYEIAIIPERRHNPEDVKVGVRLYTVISEEAGSILLSSKTIVEEKQKFHYSDIIEKEPHPLSVCWQESPPAKKIPIKNNYGTAEISLSYGENIETEMEEESSENYTELSLRHRYRFEPARLYHRGTLLTSLSLEQSPVYNAEEFVYYRSPLGVILRSKLEGFFQYLEGEPEGALEFQTELTRNFSLTSDLTYIPSIGYTYEIQSLDSTNSVERDYVSKDVFSVYDKYHDRQIFLENTFWYKPFLDLIIYAKGRIKTNRNLNPVHPDYYYGRLGLKKLWISRLESYVYHEVRKWVSDKNREKSRWENRLYAKLEYSRWWKDTRLKLQMKTRYSIEPKEFFLFVGFGADFSEGRMLRDYNPAEIDFESEKSYKKFTFDTY